MPPKTELPAALAAPGVIIRATLNLGAQECALQMEGFLDRDASQEEYDALARKMMVTAEKERARRLLPGYRHQLENQKYLLNENRKTLAGLRARIAEGIRQREAKVQELTAEMASLTAQAYDEHAASGRRSEYRAQGSTKTRVDRLETQIRDQRESMTKDEAAASEALATAENNIKDGERNVYQAEVIIAEHEKLLRGEDIAENGAAKA